MAGIRSNVAVRQGGMVTMGFNLLLALIAIVSITTPSRRARSATTVGRSLSSRPAPVTHSRDGDGWSRWSR